MPENTEDYKKWGDAWVYCDQHLRVHKTGWCGVGTHNKVFLCPGDTSQEEATQKAIDRGFKLGSANFVKKS